MMAPKKIPRLSEPDWLVAPFPGLWRLWVSPSCAALYTLYSLSVVFAYTYRHSNLVMYLQGQSAIN
jgi:hypothetical protein